MRPLATLPRYCYFAEPALSASASSLFTAVVLALRWHGRRALADNRADAIPGGEQ